MFVNYCEVRKLLPMSADLLLIMGFLVPTSDRRLMLIERREGKCVGQVG
jgi:hypothetical protein